MKMILRTAAFLVAMLSITMVRSQQVEKALDTLAINHQPEKIYIHYDKDYYVTGETIWFKAYLYNDGKPSSLSNNLYLQFLDSKGQLISSNKFPVSGASTKGSIAVPDSLPQGNYYIRALTPGMLNQEEGFVYKKNIVVYKPNTSKSASQSQTVIVQFFPEGGHLVDGILSVTAFKATDQWGTPVEVNGVIHSDDGTTIASFKSYHDGIGKVQFKPQAGKKYIAEVETDAGKRTFPLPEVRPSGVNLKVQDEKGGKKFQLSVSAKEKALYETIRLVAQINNHLVYDNEIRFEDYPSIIGHLLTDSLPSGILHFTVFSKEGMPLAERLTFVDNHEYAANASIDVVKANLDKRAENNIELSFADQIQRSCSVSVTDLPSNAWSDQENIWSRFLLTSDLKGTVYNPAWYFTNQNDSTRQAIDNLMLTHGWTRFSWKKILNNEFPDKKSNDEPLIVVTGKVVDEKTNLPLSGGKLNIFLEAQDSTSLNLETPVDNGGRFILDSLLYRGKGEFFYAYTDSKGKPKPALVILEEDTKSVTMAKLRPGSLENLVTKDVAMLSPGQEVVTRHNYVLANMNQVKELEKVTVEAKSNKKPEEAVNEKYTSGVFRSEGKITLDNINDPVNDKSMNAVDYIKNRIQQLELQNNQFVNRKNMSLMSGQKWLVGIFIDERPANMFQLRLIRAGDIALVKFFEAGFVGSGSAFPGGAVSVYTKEQDKAVNKPDKLLSVVYNGYTITKEFYNPDYSKDKQPVTDNRTTLYWNPDVYTDNETKTYRVNFYNNDFSKRFKITVEGFDANGKLIHIEKIISN